MARTMITGSTATTGGAVQTYDGSLKRWYDDTFGKLYPTFFPLLNSLSKKGRIKRISPDGEEIYFGAELSMGSGAGPVGEGDVLPTSDAVRNVQGHLPWNRGFKGRIEMTGEAFKFSKQGKGAFVSALKQETEALVNSLKAHGAAAFWGPGTGVLAYKSAALSGSATMSSIASTETSAYLRPGTRWLHEGMRMNAWTVSSGNYSDDATWTHTTVTDKIYSIDSDTQVTLGAANTAAGSNYFTALTGSIRDTGTSAANIYKGPLGITAMVDDGTFHANYCNILESTYAQWKSVLAKNSGTARALTMSLLYGLILKMMRKEGSFDLDIETWCSPDMMLLLVDLMEHYVEFKPREFKAGYDKDSVSVMVQGTPLNFKQDFWCPGGAFYCLNMGKITMAEAEPLNLITDDGQEKRAIENYDSIEMRWRWKTQMYTTKRNAHGALLDISYSVVSI